ncbi:MATE efflux family protein, partial [Nitratireductor aquibiodomus RA22]
ALVFRCGFDDIRGHDLQCRSPPHGLISAPALAAHAIAIQIASSYPCSMAWPVLSQAATVRVGRAFGAQNLDGITRAGWTAFVMGVGFMALMALLMVTIPRPLIGAFIDLDLPENAEVIGLAIVLPWLCRSTRVRGRDSAGAASSALADTPRKWAS